MKKRVLKKSVKNKLILIGISIILLIILINTIKYYRSDIHKLKKMGYSKATAKEIISINKVSDVLNNKYSNNILDILKSKYYISKNLARYIDYINNNNTTIDNAVTLVNTLRDKDFYTDGYYTNTNDGYAMLVNKYYKLNDDYKPENLVKVKNWYAYGEQLLDSEAYDAYIKLFNAAKEEGYTLIINEAYRSYEDQEKIHKRLKDDTAAKAGYSEHQTGLAIDITYPKYDDDMHSKEYNWLSENAYKFGYILRYPENKENITGYTFEPWHYRYVGVDLATKVYNSGLTFDEYYAYYIENK